MHQSFSYFLGNKKEHGYSGHIAEENIYAVIETEGVSWDIGDQCISNLRNSLKEAHIHDLATFDEAVQRAITLLNLPLSASLAVGYVKESVLYLKTVGKGEVHLIRGKDHARLIDGDANASGYLQQGDLITFSTSHFFNKADEKDMMQRADRIDVHEMTERMQHHEGIKNEEGIVAVFLQISADMGNMLVQPVQSQNIEVAPPHREPPAWLTGLKEHIAIPYRTLRERTVGAERKKKLTFIIVILISVVFIWSVVLASNRRKQETVRTSINTTRETVTAKLTQAEEVAFLNMSSALALISESKNELDALRQLVGSDPKYTKDIEEIQTLITERENSIIKKEEREFEEFYDLAVDQKNAKGDVFYRNGDLLTILDKSNGALYALSLPQKSLSKLANAELKKASFVTEYEGRQIVFVPGKGVVEIQDNTIKNLVPNDPEWGTIAGMAIYNSNIYLLDETRNSIYKYVPIAEGYSEKQDYMAPGTSVSLAGARSIAIDSSIYVSFEDHVEKFTSGLNDGLSTDFPDSSLDLDKVIADGDLANIYVWNKANGSLYTLAKDGEYIGEIQSSILKKGTDVTVYEDAAYVVDGAKIYKITL